MTTPQAAALYLGAHLSEWADKGYAVFNPNNRDISELPFIYGFNNGGPREWLQAIALAQDGTCLGQYICSAEGYMPHDLGVLEGSRPDRHEHFREHYPDGYRMDFVGFDDVPNHAGVKAALELNEKQREQAA
ncbi:MAG: hypothetical protein M9937_26390 [Chelatococcus sp.]|uniref:hypothetical protein n=1 Tax=Chelatococcus sp. TaxID=1953771 RepID=UPI0026270386|nr:hypothetical protein [Chelatococcus sp.]MCO5079202.1 hypothetical protein [Chelatococcus sp.]